MPEQKPLVSVIIVNFNAKVFLFNCLEAVFKNNYPNFEVIVVDNGSCDGSIDYIGNKFKDYKNLQLISLSDNFGPAYARNIAINNAKGRYLAFLDNDTVPEYDWLAKAIEIMEKDENIAVAQCKLLLKQYPNRLDYAGDYLSPYGFLIQRANTNEVDIGQYDEYAVIFSAKSAASIMRKDVCDKVGRFDADYFIYVEETDLCWRSYLAGYKTIFIPESRVYHEFGGSAVSLGKGQNYFAKFHGCKNYITTLLKNLEWQNIIKIVPLHICFWFIMAGWLFIHRQFNSARFVLKGIFWVIFNISSILRKRKEVSNFRVKSDKELFLHIMCKQPLSYFYKKVAKVEKTGYAQSFHRPST